MNLNYYFSSYINSFPDSYLSSKTLLEFVYFHPFETFGKLIGLNEVQVQKALHSFTGSNEQVKQLISNSYLDERSKRMYLRTYEERVSRFNRTT